MILGTKLSCNSMICKLQQEYSWLATWFCHLNVLTNSWVPQMIVVENLWMVTCNACMLEPTFYNFVVKPSLHWICYLPNIIVISWNVTSSCSWAQTKTSKQYFWHLLFSNWQKELNASNWYFFKSNVLSN
jgi:hypothetical protein